jgi:hypothetical protein
MRKEDETPDVDWRRPGGGLEAPVTGYQTAMARTGPSRPVWILARDGWLGMGGKPPSILDYGSGRGADARWLECDAYDPHFGPKRLDRRRRWDRVLMTYVVNVLDPPERRQALLDAWSLVKAGGWLLVTTRADVSTEQAGRGCTQYACASWLEHWLPRMPGVERISRPWAGKTWAVQKKRAA